MKIRALCLIALGAVAAAAYSPAQEGSFQDATTVVVVELPVNVVHDGEPVRGLTAQNFEIYDGKRLRPLIGFEVVDLAAGLEAPTSGAMERLPIAARRHFLLLFDFSFSTLDSLARSVEASRQLVEDGLHDSDLVGVAVHGGAIGAQLLLNFTPDQEQVLRTLEVLDHLLDGDVAEASSEEAREDALGLVARDVRSIAAQIGRAAGAPESTVAEYLRDASPAGDGRASAIMAEILYEMAAEETAALHERRRGEIETMASSFAELAARTAGIEGRKHLVLFSGGFDPYVFESGGGATLRSLQRAIEAFQRAGWSIQSVDPDRRGGPTFEDDAEGLVMLSRQTGGEIYRNFNHLSVAMERMLVGTSVTYLLAFQVDTTVAEGTFRPLRVRLRDGPRGAKLTHRSGYTVRTGPPDARTSQLEAAQLLLNGEVVEDIATAILAVPFKSGAGKPHVSVVLQVDGNDLLEGHEESKLAAEVYGYAFAADGVIADHFGQSFTFDLGGRRDVLASRGLKVVGDLELAAGRYSLRLLVRNPLSGRYTTKSAPIVVPSFDDDQARVMTPLFIESSAAPVVFLDGPAGRVDSSRHRFRVGGRDFIPTVEPALLPVPLVRVCVPVYQLDLERQTLSVQVLLDDGSHLTERRLRMLGAEDPDEDGLSQLLFGLDTEALPPAVYSIEVALVDKTTGVANSSTSSFEIIATAAP